MPASRSSPSLSTKALESWYQKAHRDLPWRRTRDPYAIWISEVMLQQTQVAAVIPYYESFLKNWPTLQDLANSNETKVLSAWSGLGYYSRARNLRKGAQYLCEFHKGKFPKNRDEILKVPGIGPYTAGAILSIAFNLPTPLVDGNVIRVFSRFFGETRPIEKGEVQKRFWVLAAELVQEATTPRIFNQALMELGATLCTKGDPKCQLCPIKRNCVAFKKGLQAKLPKRLPRKKVVDLHWMGIVFEYEGAYFLKKNAAGEWWQQMWDFPRIDIKEKATLEKTLSGLIEQYPHVTHWKRLAPQKHTVTHHRIHFHPFLCRLSKKQRFGTDPGRWWSKHALKEAPVSSLVKKVLQAAHE